MLLEVSCVVDIYRTKVDRCGDANSLAVPQGRRNSAAVDGADSSVPHSMLWQAFNPTNAVEWRLERRVESVVPFCRPCHGDPDKGGSCAPGATRLGRRRAGTGPRVAWV